MDSPSRPASVPLLEWRWTGLAVVACLTVLASFARLAADWDWLIPVGDYVRRTGDVPDHVPFAASPTAGWHDVPVLAQVVASLVDELAGAAGAVGIHLALVGAAMLILAASARHLGARDGRIALLLVPLTLGAMPALALVRLQSFSVLFFALLVSLLWHEAKRPSRRIWWLPLLVAIWSNFHGAVLLGVCVAGAYLLFGRLRLRPLETVAVGLMTLAALCLTPQGWLTMAYYVSVLDNEAAARGEGLWARPDIAQPFDVLMLGSIAVLAVTALRERRRAWEYLVCLGLAAATVEAARHGVWLLFVLFVMASVSHEQGGPPSSDSHRWAWRPLALVTAISASLMTAILLTRGATVEGVDPAVVEAVVTEAGDDVVLAPAPLVESLAAAGVMVWAGNPLDAFTPEAQGAYLDFVAGKSGMAPAVRDSDLIVVTEGSKAEAGLLALGETFERSDLPGGYVAYRPF